MVTYESLRQDDEIKAYIEAADASLDALGFTEHSYAHITRVASVAGDLLEKLGRDAHTVELSRIAGYLHDIGNTVNRIDHSQSGAIIAFRLLEKRGMPARDIATVVTAIGNHDEGTGVPVSDVSAALILADKSDVRRSRVRHPEALNMQDIHDRVNASVERSELVLSEDCKTATLVLTVSEETGSMVDFFEIFLGRMLLCRRACERLGLAFRVEANGQRLL